MLSIRARNINDAYTQGMCLMAQHGVTRTTRNGPAYVVPEPVATHYGAPCERVLFDEARDANPFFHLFEALWMLSGADDVAVPAFFVPQIAMYSDDGLTFHAAYGERWNRYDQLERTIQHLQQDPTSRRAIIELWDPLLDGFPFTSKDFPCNTTLKLEIVDGALNMVVFNRSNDIVWGCLAADTPVLSPEGDISIEQLAAHFQRGGGRYPVYSVDTATGKTSFQWCTNAWRTGIKPVLELSFDDGSSLKLTENHKLYKRKWKNASDQTITEVRAGELQVGDHVWAPRPYQKIGGRWYFKSSLFNDNRINHKTSVEYAKFLHGPIPAGHVVHHKNNMKWDDRAENLEVKPKGRHMTDHLLENNPGFDKVNREMTREERARRGRRGNSSRWSDPAQHRKQRRLMRKLYREGRINHKIIGIRHLDPEPVYDFTVENTHTALVGTGVLAHNCYGANAVHFSVLQEYVACVLGVNVGWYEQISCNFHAYCGTERNGYDRLWPLANLGRTLDPYSPHWDPVHRSPSVTMFPLLGNTPEERKLFDYEVQVLCHDIRTYATGGPNIVQSFRSAFLERVAAPMLVAFLRYREGSRMVATADKFMKIQQGLGQLADAQILYGPIDWLVAGHRWLTRRMH